MNQLAAHMSTDATSEPEILFRDQFAARIYTLNRPARRNALTHEMVKTLRAQIEVGKPNASRGILNQRSKQEWDESELCSVIVGTGKNHFCAGGDVQSVYICTLAQCTGKC